MFLYSFFIPHVFKGALCNYFLIKKFYFLPGAFEKDGLKSCRLTWGEDTKWVGY